MLKKFTVLLLILSATMVSGCSRNNVSDMPKAQGMTRLKTEQTMDVGGLKMTGKTPPVRRGETFTITMQGRPGITYTVVGTYKRNGKTLTAYQNANADKNGIIRWSWVIAADTDPGIYPLMITGGDDTFVSSYQVLK